MVDATYSIGWALCHFLQHYDNGKYRDGFNKWFQAELDKQSSPEVFEKIFGLDSDEKWQAFDLEFQNYLCVTLRKEGKKIVAKDPKFFEKYQKDFEAACEKKQ